MTAYRRGNIETAMNEQKSIATTCPLPEHKLYWAERLDTGNKYYCEGEGCNYGEITTAPPDSHRISVHVNFDVANGGHEKPLQHIQQN